MTREEAIANLNMISVAFVDPVTGEQRKLIDDTFEMAIKALAQEPCEDAISRQAMLKTQAKYAEYMGATKFWQMCDDIKELPPVTPQQKTGHWITKEAYSEDKAMGFTEQIVCSNCDMQNSYFSEWNECKNPISKTFIRSKFCPNCGCRMVEPQESEKRSDKE